APLGVLANALLAGGDVDAINLIARDIALHPLDLRSHAAQHTTGFLRNGLQLFRLQTTSVGDFRSTTYFGMRRLYSSARLLWGSGRASRVVRRQCRKPGHCWLGTRSRT